MKGVCFIFILSLAKLCFGQDNNDWLISEETFEIAEEIQAFDINKEPVNALQFGLISSEQYLALSEYIKTNGPLIHLYELQAIEQFDPATIRNLQSFVKISGRSDFRERSGFLITRVKYRSAFQETEHPSIIEQFNSLTRIEQRLGNWKFRISTESDPGEESFQFNSIGIQYQDPSLEVTLGRFHAGWGQGLVIWNNYGSQGSKHLLGFAKPTGRTTLLSGSNEWNYFQGIALDKTIANYFKLKLLFSDAAYSASVEHGSITSLFKTGLFDSPQSLEKYHNHRQRVMAARIEQDFSKLNLGVSALNWRSTLPINSEQRTDQILTSYSNEFNSISTDFSLNVQNSAIFGEFSYSVESLNAVLGAMGSFNKTLRIGLIGRKINRHRLYEFSAPYAKGYQQETGLSVSLEYQLRRKEKLNLFYDFSLSTAAGYQIPIPQEFSEWQVYWSKRRAIKQQALLSYKESWSTNGQINRQRLLRARYQMEFAQLIAHRIRIESVIGLNQTKPSYLMYYQLSHRSSIGVNQNLRINQFYIPNQGQPFYQSLPTLWLSSGFQTFSKSGNCISYKVNKTLYEWRAELHVNYINYANRNLSSVIHVGFQITRRW